MKTQMGSRGIAIFICNLNTRWGGCPIPCVPWPLFTLWRTPVPIVKAGRAPGLVSAGMEKRNCLASTGVPTPDCQTCSELLYGLCFSIEINHKNTTNPIENTCFFLSYWRLLYRKGHSKMHDTDKICMHFHISCFTNSGTINLSLHE